MDGQNGVAVLKHVQRELELGPKMKSKLLKMVENLVLAKKLNMKVVIMVHVLVRFWKMLAQNKIKPKLHTFLIHKNAQRI